MKEVNLHINNGGISLSIEKNEWEYDNIKSINPILVIKTTHFEHQTNQMKIHLTPQQLKAIGEWMIEETKNYSGKNNITDVDISMSIDIKK